MKSRWDTENVKRINFEIRIPGDLGAAAERAVARWNKETKQVGLRLTSTRPWLTTRKPADRNGRNEIYRYEITKNERWAECRRMWSKFSILKETDIRLDDSKPYSPDFVYFVCLHEIGHALGLDHSPEHYSMMNERGPAYLTDLQPEDILALRKIYS